MGLSEIEQFLLTLQQKMLEGQDALEIWSELTVPVTPAEDTILEEDITEDPEPVIDLKFPDSDTKIEFSEDRRIAVDFWAEITGNGVGNGTFQDWKQKAENAGSFSDFDNPMEGDANNILVDSNTLYTIPNPDKSWPGTTRGNAIVRVVSIEIASDGKTRYYFSWNGLGTCDSPKDFGGTYQAAADTTTWDQVQQGASEDGLKEYGWMPHVAISSNGDGTANYTFTIKKRPLYGDSEGAALYRDQEEIVHQFTLTATEGSGS